MNGAGVALVDAGIALTVVSLLLIVKPLPPLRVRSRAQAAALGIGGVLLIAAGCALPAPDSRADPLSSRIDEYMPVWQFGEFHTRRIAAPPSRVYAAIGQVRADEIFLFETLIAIRRGGRPMPPGILNPGARESLIDVATRTTFARLVDEAPRELVVGTVIVAPPGTRGTLSPALFQRNLPEGFVLATMNFKVIPDGTEASIVTTETRVSANSPSARRRFAAYWRVIYPGSALIRRMWLRAIEQRATRP
jgi:hypothetical protein